LPVQVPDLDTRSPLARRHLVIGWWSIFVFSTLGLALETLHGFKVGAYLDVSSETRRLMWTLAHTHGTLLGVVNIAFSLTLPYAPALGVAEGRLVSNTLLWAAVLLPGGFFLGGVQFYAGDPGLGIVLVPVGAALLLYATWTIARAVQKGPGAGPPKGGPHGRK
jgi:hypothetical protein